jgi:hypothetical protein
VEQGEARYRAVRLKRRQQAALLRAGIEDTEEADLIRVADARMAVYLADVLNALDRGQSLPAAGEQHNPTRFQLIHDPTGLTPTVGVVYVHRSRSRMVVNAPSEALAQTIARVLNHVNYPMIELKSWLGTVRPGQMVESVPQLPDASVPSRKAGRSRFRVAGYVVASTLPIALLLGLLAVVRWPYALAAVIGYAVFYRVIQATLRRS